MDETTKPRGLDSSGDPGGHPKGEVMTLVLLTGPTEIYKGPKRVIAEDGGSSSSGSGPGYP